MEMLKLWLFSNISPWDLVVQNWRKTAALRMNQLQNLENLSLSELINEWPRFNDENGYQLVGFKLL